MAANTDLPEWLIRMLMAKGLTASQAKSRTAEVVAETLNTEDNKALLKLTRDQCNEMVTATQKRLTEMQELHKDLSDKVKSISDTILAIKNATDEYGEISDQKAKDAISFFAALLAIGEKYTGADVIGAGYMVYAYLGGQAARVTYPYEPNYAKPSNCHDGRSLARPL